MAEIRSTLDLIMERTKNFTLTDEEKRDLDAKERKDRIRGWCRRYLDGAVTIAELKENMDRERASSPDASSFLREECLSHVNPEQDNGKIFLVLEEVLGAAITGLVALIGDYQEELRRCRGTAGKEALEMLATRGIRGSAVLPNPQQSPSWQARADAARQRFQEQLYRVR